MKRLKEGRARYHYDLEAAGDLPHDVQKVNVSAGTDGHSATFPTRLIEPRILSSSPRDDIVLDPFAGTGTSLVVAASNARRAIGFELNERFVRAALKKLNGVQQPLF